MSPDGVWYGGADVTNDLVVSERARLDGLEAVIDNGLRTFVEVGQALAEIRSERLYRGTHGTFEDYCRERWDFSDSRARQLTLAAQTVTNVTVAGLPAPASEGVARELVPLREDPGALQAAWQEAIERHGEKPTAEQVREIVRRPAPSATPPSNSTGPRALGQARKAVDNATQNCWALTLGLQHADLTAISQLELDPEGAEQWNRTLREARTWISRLLTALSRDE